MKGEHIQTCFQLSASGGSGGAEWCRESCVFAPVKSGAGEVRVRKTEQELREIFVRDRAVRRVRGLSLDDNYPPGDLSFQIDI